MLQTKSNILPLLCCICLLFSCSKDEDTDGEKVPNMQTEFCNMYINSDKRAESITMDNGTTYDILSQGIRSDMADTTVRSVITYSTDNDKPRIYSYNPAICKEALPQEKFKITPKDPVKVISVWKGSKYINMVLGEMTTKKANHSYAFMIDEVKNRKLYVWLIHLQPTEDAESYTEKIYASLPLQTSYADGYDSVAISITTYEGVRTYSFSATPQ